MNVNSITLTLTLTREQAAALYALLHVTLDDEDLQDDEAEAFSRVYDMLGRKLKP